MNDDLVGGVIREEGNSSAAWVVSTSLDGSRDGVRQSLGVFAASLATPLKSAAVITSRNLEDPPELIYSLWPPEQIKSELSQRHVRDLAEWCDQQQGKRIEGIVGIMDSPPTVSRYYFVQGDRDAGAGGTSVYVVDLGQKPPSLVTVPAAAAQRPAVEWGLLEPRTIGETTTPAHRLRSIQWDDTTPLGARPYILGVLEGYLSSGSQSATIKAQVPLSPDRVCCVEFDLSGDDGRGVAVSVRWRGIQVPPPLLAPRLAQLEPSRFAAEWSRLHPATDTGIQVDLERASSIVRSSLNAAWFKDNYDIWVLDARAAADWMVGQSRESSESAEGLLNFTYADLVAIELALQQIGRPAIDSLKGVRLVRKERRALATTPGGTIGSLQSGLTLTEGSKATVIIYDAAFLNDTTLWTGTLPRWPVQAWTIVHEFGHVLAERRFDVPAFDARFAANAANFTWYASSMPSTEALPEAFSLYVLDNEWLAARIPELAKWFDSQTFEDHAPREREQP